MALTSLSPQVATTDESDSKFSAARSLQGIFSGQAYGPDEVSTRWVSSSRKRAARSQVSEIIADVFGQL
ncbi:hypothetical protein X760_32625 [Mesorhizobium sp. LSHC422A00]|nr:hypothetical protein X762_31405 [Mesorhizobium sp. LSHC426A00]ESX45212.1 hypothetical protein X761_32675 [Mesorhizobium sp. LSHC424B00]ESX48702.1 hypothetical protein X760_32625 [Mesorhizobium sp. LSHC422A00]ESX63958.1 hypothetical protein X758_32595 [Mesorhizobium sp. LSHC416B00]